MTRESETVAPLARRRAGMVALPAVCALLALIAAPAGVAAQAQQQAPTAPSIFGGQTPTPA
ncbi:MAG: hypothetical protein F4Z04_13555, partial [Acidobacteria bacterium]|nr:hypothetical protein [Acidobacteriota bacterium]